MLIKPCRIIKFDNMQFDKITKIYDIEIYVIMTAKS